MAATTEKAKTHGITKGQENVTVSPREPYVMTTHGRFYVRTVPSSITKIMEKDDENIQIRLVAKKMRYRDLGHSPLTGLEYMEAIESIIEQWKEKVMPNISLIQSKITDFVLSSKDGESEFSTGDEIEEIEILEEDDQE